MAKGKKGGAKSRDEDANDPLRAPAGGSTASASKELQEAIGVFSKGDYARARNMLDVKANDPSLPEGAKEQAREMITATRIERGTLYVGLACIALFALVLIVTSVMQPHT